MTLLSFTARNHKSIRDEVTVDFQRPSLKTLRPKDDDWSAASYPIAGIFGGNATGKSSILDALIYAVSAIRYSATTWQASSTMSRAPFLLDQASSEAPSLYELDIVLDGRRHLYGFEVDASGIRREWLRDLPASRWRTLLERDREAGTLKFHQSLRARIEVTARELVLSRALLLETSSLHPIAEALVSSIDVVLVKDSHREQRLASIAHALRSGEISYADLEALLRVADIGITKVDLEERNLPEHISRAVNRFLHEVRSDGEDKENDDAPQLDDDLAAQVIRSLIFTHRGTSEDCPPFSILDESDGTIAWLAIGVPALDALRSGGLLLVDEIDASLHPHLLEVLLGAFADPLVNTRHGQLIFTSHESYVLSPLSDVTLEPEQIWFTDKTYEGVTELTCLADFPKHPDANVAKRYLTGRYGGTPRLSPSILAALVGAEGD
ncbi:AAA family ATPase [Brachybacterium sp. DNPG3]